MPESSEKRSKILITGSGDSGSTWLWRLMNELGYSGIVPGYTEEACIELLKNSHILERINKKEKDWPVTIKHTGGFLTNLHGHATKNSWKVGHVFAIIRTMDGALRRAKKEGGISRKVLAMDPIDFEWTDEDTRDFLFRNRLWRGMGQLAFSCAEHNYPLTILSFPRAISDVEYAWEKIGATLNIRPLTFEDAWSRSLQAKPCFLPEHYEWEGVEPPQSLIEWWKNNGITYP